MRAGPLDRRVVLQRKTVGSSDSGEPIDTWTTIGNPRWASRAPVTGSERFIVDQFAALEQVEFNIRWSIDLEDLQPQDRLIEPASDGDDPPERSIYDIFAVYQIGRREGFRVMAVRRVDVP